MVQKYVYGVPIETEAVVQKMDICTDSMPVGSTVVDDSGYHFAYTMDDDDIVYGLGEANRGINKRGYIYVNDCTDDMLHTEAKVSLYCAHNFIIIRGKKTIGLFWDYPAKITFDIGYTHYNQMKVDCDYADLYVYLITGNSSKDVAKQFRQIIGRSYIPPKWGMGYAQSRFGYKSMQDFREVVENHKKNGIPLDAVYMDIDYMDHYKDFTVNTEEFPDFPAFVEEMKAQNIHLVPIIDAAVKIEEGYDICEEGVKNNYFCKDIDGNDFETAAWPGPTYLPDVLNADARQWFGSKYRWLIEQGIDGFWNDMNEPSIFYSAEGMKEFKQFLKEYIDMPVGDMPFYIVPMKFGQMTNSPEDYKRIYHNIDGKKVSHDRVHNLYGYNMTRAAGDAFEQIDPDKRILMFSRSSYIGMHRYGGIWTGDNQSWWSHLLLSIKMMPSLNMCGFLYAGSDIGGFGENTTRDLLLRWLAFGVFTPLMRNHAAFRTRDQECYLFEKPEDFAHVIGVRYRLLPYLYSEYIKAALDDDMYFRPLAFDYPDDKMAETVEDQLMLGHALMVTPVYTQNARGRYVYLPEDMLFVKFMPDGSLYEEKMTKGHHYIEVALNEVPIFIKKGQFIPIAGSAENIEVLSTENMSLVGWVEGSATYKLYDDDGYGKAYENPENYVMLYK